MDDLHGTPSSAKPSATSSTSPALSETPSASLQMGSLNSEATAAQVLRWAVAQLASVRPWDSTGTTGSAGNADTTGNTGSTDRAASDRGAADPGEAGTTGGANSEDEQIARSEAQWLLEWAADWSRSRLLMHMNDGVPEEALTKFQAALSRRLAGEPLQYIMGVAPFYGRDFVVRPGCLIPRPETEILADEAIRFARKHLRSGSVLDIGTGSGALAVTLKLECPGLDVCAIDISPEALSIARENADRLSANLTFLQVDAFKWLGLPFGLPSPVHMIVSNPPYIPKQDVEELSNDVKEHEPRLALDGGDDGLDFYRLFANRAIRSFAPGNAAIFLEVGIGQADDVKALFEVREDWAEWKFDVIPDLRGIPRVVRGVRV